MNKMPELDFGKYSITGHPDTEHFYGAMMGRPMCRICGYNPGYWKPPDHLTELNQPKDQWDRERGLAGLDDKGGYWDNYPQNVWFLHVKMKHRELIGDLKKFERTEKWGLL